ncbi:thioredoxin family protein [Pseudooceanicola nanhaiensis]|uniref:thioredoxin family protein n=1 Tax=Pseudooceanicola nanhaiensis TaxID=375761 RepID=UPI001CD26AEF|nr:thioredoxin family protein [Pseudooceanicola nanhaiensis]MCA0919327.1 thioredoxin family protein [Pseudooceanicola nanhaiensis]
MRLLPALVPAIAPALALVACLAPGGAAALDLIMVERPGCAYCAAWNRTIAPIYPKTAAGESAPLVRMDISEAPPEGVTFARPVVFTPTFILVDEGTELGRIEGYPGEDFFWGLLEKMLSEQTDTDRAS